MVKTAVQELIEVLKELEENESINDIHFKYFLDKEEKQIINARADGFHSGLYNKEIESVTHQQYYNNTYNQD